MSGQLNTLSFNDIGSYFILNFFGGTNNHFSPQVDASMCLLML